jgi:hypothetical protein
MKYIKLFEELRLNNSKPKIGDKIVDGNTEISGTITRFDDKGVAFVDFGDGYEMSYYLQNFKKNGKDWIVEKSINELRETEMNEILDKISDGTATDEDRAKLDNFDGTFDDSKQDTTEIDSEGDIRVNGERLNPYEISDDFYDDGDLQADREVTIELEKEIQYFLDESYHKSGNVIINNETEESVNEPSQIQKRLLHEFGISQEDAQRIVFNWYKSIRR